MYGLRLYYIRKGMKCSKTNFNVNIVCFGHKYIDIGLSGIGSHCLIECFDNYNGQSFTPSIKIGDNCWIGEYTHLTSINKITIGNSVLTGRYVLISDNNHGQFDMNELNMDPKQRPLYSKGEINIEDNVWIGDKVTILSNVTIGKGSIIAANAVVTKNIPPYTLVAGNPAKIIKTFEI